jgi:hypothetical protein
MTKHEVFISASPEDPIEKNAWVKQMLRVQVAMWVDNNAICAYCGHKYNSVDDFLKCDPKRGYGKDTFICDNCWVEYAKGKTK